ncbi:methionyl-tRNA formyltransferase [Desulfovibrio sp. 86]|uniref:Formyl transferase domain protein n=1 Tax=uncultured Desulfovibrio sp. TaxID=167968 RepID=A0A212L7D3_9BACT|nr:methionyl-tRNA formyltransferase [Desulfovibrio sp. 86]SCM73482.1 Formyl transferase domain protein [uncultured Desulfovibrio sp.]VZH34224.1 Formyl transferase domain protein [Desulfovibrio sp. 86]
MKESYIIAGSRPWCVNAVKHLKNKNIDFFYIKNKEDLNLKSIVSINPRYIFFPHWSWVIPATIWNQYECIVFHMTDLPFGRGGSPLQNLIARGFTETKISALRCEAELDAGPIYIKRPLSLLGTAEEIFIRANNCIADMINEIIITHPNPMPQLGEPTYFKRRLPQDSNVSEVTSLEALFDRIRMLDAEGYPQAFIDINDFRLEFSRASLKTDKIFADVRITRRDKQNDQSQSQK